MGIRKRGQWELATGLHLLRYRYSGSGESNKLSSEALICQDTESDTSLSTRVPLITFKTVKLLAYLMSARERLLNMCAIDVH
jgi:hypothetical protein